MGAPRGGPDFEMELDEKSGKSVSWEMVLNNQVSRINQLMTFKMSEFPTSVEALKSNLVFFTDKDKKYHQEMREIELWSQQEMESRRDSSGNVQGAEIEDVAYARAKLTFEACLRAMGRAGFYPQRRVDFRE